jgi:beta-mannosidase
VRGRIRSATAVHAGLLASGWEFVAVAPDSISEPAELPSDGWLEASVPSTVAASLRAAGKVNLDACTRRFDAEDYWWRHRFAARAGSFELCFEGLATLCDVWLNGALIGSSRNMFAPLTLDVTLAAENELVLRFRSLEKALGGRRPRPRWRVPMLEQQQLRWFRTTLLGRTPGWSPPWPAVGPYRSVTLQHRTGPSLCDVRMNARLEAATGVLTLDAAVLGSAESVTLVARRGDSEYRSAATLASDGLRGELRIENVERWWPHTHGEAALYQVHVELAHAAGTERVELGAVGFRQLFIDRENGDFRVSVNGVPIFCRGACWTPLDAATLNSERTALLPVLERVRDAGMNMLRVGGTMVYETDDFYDLCDELGILVWQDFMFANMEYPNDEAFTSEVRREVSAELARLQARPALALLCGSSEGEQQPAMWGAPREQWNQPLFYELLPSLVAELCPDTLYWPSSAHGGEFPHVSWAGTTSYYGVGAYLRPLEDARRSEIRFASECLAFANIPSEEALPGGPAVKVHHPAWKARSPRDLGAGWDFDDVRDHYVEQLFDVDALKLRYSNHDRYFELGRVASGEVMAAAFSEWRRGRSQCRGALIWFLKDFWASAGWGILDAQSAPKAPYWYVRRACQPVFVGFSDEGLNGLSLHLTNEHGAQLKGEVRLRFFRQRETLVSELVKPIELAPREAREVPVASWLDGFHDLTFSYRFGPTAYDLVAAALFADGACVGRAVYLPLGLALPQEADLGVTARASARPDGNFELLLGTRRFAQSVCVKLTGALASDDYVHIAPGDEVKILLKPNAPAVVPRGSVQPLNAFAATPIVFAT